MKRKKNSLFVIIAASSLLLSAGVGFATWTISGGFDSKTDTGLKITADPNVEDKRIKITKLEATDSSVQFKPVISSNNSYQYSWLQASDYLTAEDLTAIYTLTGTAQNNQVLKIEASLEETTTGDNTYASLAKAGIVGAIPTPELAGTSGNTITANSNGDFSATVDITFSWGSQFGSVNPYTYFNNKPYSDKLAEEAKKNIGMLSILSSCTFELTVTVSDGST